MLPIAIPQSNHPVKQAHLTALTEVYPIVFGTQRIRSFDITPKSATNAYLYKLAIRGSLGVYNVTTYEKFRSIENVQYRSITFTHVDAGGSIADQFHDNPAQFTTQGFFDYTRGRFVGPLIVLSLADVIWRISTGRVPYKLRNRPRTVCTYAEVMITDLIPFAIYHKEYSL